MGNQKTRGSKRESGAPLSGLPIHSTSPARGLAGASLSVQASFSSLRLHPAPRSLSHWRRTGSPGRFFFSFLLSISLPACLPACHPRTPPCCLCSLSSGLLACH